MAWMLLTENEVLTRLAGPEVAAYKAAALKVDQGDPLPEIVQGVVREVRGRVAACAKNVLGDGQTIPDELEHHALALVRYRLTTRLPLVLTAARTKEYEDAMEVLKDVAKCNLSIEPPFTPTTEVQAVTRPSICGRRPQFTRRDQEGI